ncbi:MAG: hypothetical protein A2X48_24390 [Lentisphaerae bacterium GWF2_49_21]|nr:MAG: hypothetical protein A2X48_24390 [Lentisphaerae bacterium GWF2_49_21]
MIRAEARQIPHVPADMQTDKSAHGMNFINQLLFVWKNKFLVNLGSDKRCCGISDSDDVGTCINLIFCEIRSVFYDDFKRSLMNFSSS